MSGEEQLTLEGSFQQPQPQTQSNSSSSPRNDADFVGDERENLMQELSSTMIFHDIDRPLLTTDDTGMYSIIAQMSKKVAQVDSQLQNPPVLVKITENMARIDEVEQRIDTVLEAITALSRRINSIHGEEQEESEEWAATPTPSTPSGEEKKDNTTPAPAPAPTPSTPQVPSTSASAQKLTKPMEKMNSVDVEKNFAALKLEIKQRERNLRFENDNTFSELDMKNQRLLAKLNAEYPSISEFNQFKEFTAERAKKQKLKMQKSNSDIQRSLDEKFTNEFESIMKWKETFSTATLDRMKSVEDLVRSFSEDLTYLRGGVDEHVHMLEERIQDNQMWCQKKFSDIANEIKKANTKIHDLQAKQKEHSIELETHSEKLVSLDETVDENKEAAFAQFMALQMKIDEINQVNFEQNDKHTALVDQVVMLETRIDSHDSKLVEKSEQIDVQIAKVVELQKQDVRIFSNLKNIEEVQLVEVKKVAEEATATLQDAVETIIKTDIQNIQSFNKVMKTEMTAVKEEVSEIPAKFNTVKESIVAVKAVQVAHKEEVTQSGGELVSLTERIKDLEQSTTAIRPLKDKSIELADGLAGLESAIKSTLKKNEGSEIALDKVTQDTAALEKKLVREIANCQKLSRDEVNSKVEEMQQEIQEMESKTTDIVQEILESNPKLLGKKGSKGPMAGGGGGGHSGGHAHMGGGGGGGGFGGIDDSAQRRGSAIGLTLEEIQEYEQESADVAKDIIVSFEEKCVLKTYVVDEIPQDLRSQMTELCQDMSEFISSKADQDAIDRMIRGSAEDVVYTDDEVDASRMAMLNNWMARVARNVAVSKQSVSKVRMEAREKILKKLSDAIDMALSKHDQVLITGHSRLGRVQLPTCLACDRPLANKQRARDKRGEGGGEEFVRVVMKGGGKQVYEKAAPVPKIGRMGVMSAGTRGQAGGGGGGPELDLAMEKIAMSHHGMNPAALTGTIRPVTAGDAYKKRPVFGGNNGGIENSYIYKGGFKMPYNPEEGLGGGGGLGHSGKVINLPMVGYQK